MKNITAILLVMLALQVNAKPFQPSQSIPLPLSTVNDVVNSLYSIISGPAGERDWAKLENLFYKDGYMGVSQPTANGAIFRKFSVGEYAKTSGQLFKQFAFTERELGRSVHEFGNLAQVFTSYEFELASPKPVKRRGINSIQLVKENGRWWILNVIWQEETPELPIPAKYLNK